MQEIHTLIDTLHLLPHPEGGHYREVHRSKTIVKDLNGALDKSAYTSIYYLLSGKDFSSYNKMQIEIDNVQKRIIEIDAIMKKNSSRATYDIDTSLAKKHETSLLTKQRYYVYIIWFIILAIILYITITNLLDADSSFSVLLVTILLLICLLLYFMYSKWSVEWYDFKYKLKNLDFGLPEIPKIDFNPLVSIKYTS